MAAWRSSDGEIYYEQIQAITKHEDLVVSQDRLTAGDRVKIQCNHPVPSKFKQ